MSRFGTRASKHPGGRPPVNVNLKELNRLRTKGMSWRHIGQTLRIGASTALYLWRDGTTPRGPNKPVQKPRGDDFAREVEKGGGRGGSLQPLDRMNVRGTTTGKSDEVQAG